ncbi:MAG: PadR family transcriptional regulator [Thermomicrobiales bacterium]
MSATRLLVLGVVRMYGRTHGYRIGTDLVAWGGEEWANLKWGSLYHALRQLAKQGMLTVTEIEEWPGRADYEMTDAGEAEFFRLLRDALRRPEHRPDMLGAGLILLPALPRAEAIALLKERLDELEAERDEVAEVAATTDNPERPAHLTELYGYWVHAADSGGAWTRGLIARLQAGAYVMADEDDQAFGGAGIWPAPNPSSDD